jgi:hypothetical protein
MSGDGTKPAGKPWWRQAATLVGVCGLAATLVFNTLAVRSSAKQDHQSRETGQIGLLTQLNSNASDSERAINETHAVDRLCVQPPAPLDEKASAALHEGLDYYEYLSWLFNHGRLTVAGSRDFFGVRMIDGWRVGRHFFGEEVPARYKELDRFVRETPLAKRGENPCPS